MKRLVSGFPGIVKVHPQHLRTLAANKATSGKIAAGFKPRPRLDLKFMGGRTIRNLSFRSFYLGGAGWPKSDIQNIDQALSGAMADPHLNNVMQQYFPGGKSITTKFLGSTKLSGTVKKTFTRDDVNPTLQGLLNRGALNGVDFDSTVICLFLPPKIVLTTDAADGVGKLKLKGDADEDSSEEGLGGYHGSCHIGNQRIYFAVGVYSQFIGNNPNGIPVWPDAWKNIVATFYHELNEARTDPDVEDAIRNDNDHLLGWYANVKGAGEVGDTPMNEAGPNLNLVMVEVPLANGMSAPIQLMWSNKVHGPQGPFA
jgi:hypothetical protein